jgi:octaprenyl-diphosphate synthase
MQLSIQSDIAVSPPGHVIPAFKLIHKELMQVSELVRVQLAGCPAREGISQLTERLSGGAGKMIRPGLVLLSSRAVRDARCEGTSRGAAGSRGDDAVRAAAIVEMIHNAALLHDDVIDEGQKRRGRPTVNRLWGNESAVVLGDFLLSRVFLMCADLEPGLQRIIADATARTCEGELRQISQRGNWQISEGEYIEIVTEKTAAIFAACCHLGALLGGAGEKEIEGLTAFGLNAGIAFQITDDLLDITGDEKKTGKTLGSDICKSKPTLAVIHLLGAADKKERILVKKKLSTGEIGRKALTEMLRLHGSLDYARSRAEEFTAKAVLSLRVLKKSSARDALTEAAGFIGRRAV